MRWKAAQRTVLYELESGNFKVESKAPEVVREDELSKQVESSVVGVYPDYLFQTVEGFGCAMTESSCFLLSKMDAQTRKRALGQWFGPEHIDARFIRISIDSCDYSLSEYQAVDDPLADPDLQTFSIKRDRRYILPVVKEALELSGGKLSVLLSPWSPPAAWKTVPELSQNDAAVYGGLGQEADLSKPSRCFGGRLKREYYGSWAQYLCKYIQAYLEEGIPVTMLSVQNETAAATNWDSCIWSGEEEAVFLKDYLYPEMSAAGLTGKVGIYIWDHNKERMVEYVDAMMREDILDMVEGVAYHWYSGDHFDALSLIHAKYPAKVLMHSESCGLHIPGKALSFETPVSSLEEIPEEIRGQIPQFVLEALSADPKEVDFKDAVDYGHDMIGDLRHGMQRWIDWNLCVDRKGGPRHVPGGFAAPIVAEADGTYTLTVSYAYIEEIARAVIPGSVVIGSSVYAAAIETVAVKRPDGKIGILLLNREKKEQQINIRIDGNLCTVSLPGNSISSVLLEK